MDVGVIGTNFKTADLTKREDVFNKIQSAFFPFPHILLSTCNRIEIYCPTENLPTLIPFFQEGHFYLYQDKECFLHLVKVMTGFDSALFMESAIQKQVKIAYQQSQHLPSSLHYLFQKGLRIAKKIRSLFQEKEHFRLEKTLLNTSYLFFKDLSTIHVLFVGFSQTNRLIASYFQRKQKMKIFWTSEKKNAQIFCKERSFDFIPFSPQHLFDFDLIIVASNNPVYHITKDHYRDSAKKTRLIFDLSVPRLIDPALSTFINLIDIDHLNIPPVEKTPISIELLLSQEVDRYTSLFENKTLSCL